ncbi:MAG: hypothetical protein HGA36_03780 [Candidatus Moranbacteria bacterium]|nr:hypothetical protein [Candidatus Moranbacteria bacterium]
MQKYIFKIIFLFVIFLTVPNFVQAAPEVANNGIDEDGDGWLGTTGGYQIRASHPRVLLDSTMLSQTIDRMYGANAREPYASWFNLIKAKEDTLHNVDLANLALIYKATGLQVYKDRFIASIPATGEPWLTELYALDIMFDDLDAAVKTNVVQRMNAVGSNVFYYNSVNESNNAALSSWGYHSPIGVTRALAYAGLFAYSGFESGSTFNVNNYFASAKKELYPGGNFYNIERRVGGDPTHNDALPGSFGGMYDNFGYDGGEDSYGIDMFLQYKNLTGENVAESFLRDKYRGDFYQNMQYPYHFNYSAVDTYCMRAGTEAHWLANIWNTQTDYSTQPQADTVSPLSSIYQDKRMQYFANNGYNRVLCGHEYEGMFWDLIFYDDNLSEEAPATNPTAKYFNGPGLVSMRSDWTNDALFSVLVAGEGISRRYEDGNSFLLGRKAHVVVQAGARIRGNADNEKEHWYAIRSASKNTMKIFDPQESFDINADGTTKTLHAGTLLVPSDNLGGQIFETNPSKTDECYYAPDGSTGACAASLTRGSSAFPLGVYETANVTKFEHNPTAGYTYSVGDATAAYTKKIDFFEREFLYLRPDKLVIFDRVKSVDPNYKKVWTIHTVDEPVAQSVPNETGLGMKANTNNVSAIISNPLNTTYIDSLLPKQNKVVTRGGDTALVKEKPLRTGQDIASQDIAIANTDIPRWLEFLGVGADGIGSLVVSGATQEGDTAETINFIGKIQTDADARPGSMTSTLLTDTTKKWIPDQWKNYGIRTQCAGNVYESIITANTATTITATFPSTSCWEYQVYKYVANSYKHWNRIDSITTSNLDFNYLTVSVPHYFDAMGANGKLYNFAPHTDQVNDYYAKRKDLGQWTFEVEATQPQLLDNFLNVMSLKDPGVSNSDNRLIEGAGFSGVVVDDQFAIFANDKVNLTSIDVTIPKNGNLTGLFLDLTPNTNYYYKTVGNVVSFSSTNNGGSLVTSSAMGTANVNVAILGNDITAPSAPSGFLVM